MGVFYQPADVDVTNVIDSMIAKYHGELRDQKTGVNVKIDALMAFAEEGPAVTLHGVACYAKVRIVNLRDRAKGCGDAEIIIDAEKWQKLTPERRNALIDHELEHLELKFKAGVPDFDDLQRPKLKLRPHDMDFGWFTSVARRHQEHSIEVAQAQQCYKQHQMLLFDVGDVATSASRESNADAELEKQLTKMGKLGDGSGDVSISVNGGPEFNLSDPKQLKKAAGELKSMVQVKVNKAIQVNAKMLDLRDRFERFAGEKYADFVRWAKADIQKQMNGSKPAMAVGIEKARNALEEEGNYNKMLMYVAATVEMCESSQAAASAA